MNSKGVATDSANIAKKCLAKSGKVIIICRKSDMGLITIQLHSFYRVIRP
jgi:DNA-directed RNA polymerase subunit H (RpoH/RPB5)